MNPEVVLKTNWVVYEDNFTADSSLQFVGNEPGHKTKFEGDWMYPYVSGKLFDFIF